MDCPLCRYGGDAVGSGSGAVFLSVSDRVDLCFGDVFSKTIATRAMPWTTETLTAFTGDTLGFARASDGTSWMLYADSGNGIGMAHRASTLWTTETVAQSSGIGALVLASDGTPWVAFAGQNPMTGATGVIVAHRDGAGAWKRTRPPPS